MLFFGEFRRSSRDLYRTFPGTFVKILRKVTGAIFGKTFSENCFYDNLREFVLVYDRNPESMRTFPGVCPAGGDSVSAEPVDCLQNRLFLFSKEQQNWPETEKCSET